MFLGMVRWPRVGPWRWRIVLRPVPPLSSASTSDHRKATFLLGRRIYFLGGCWYINFEAKYTSATWEHFDQVAHFQTGKPMALCRRCGKALPHPSSTSNGSKSLAAHLSSRACRVAGQKESTQQDIQQSLQLSVYYIS